MTSLVGRDAELAKLRLVAGEAAKGSGRLVFVTGDAGSGKTSLVAAALAGVPLTAIHGGANPVATAPLGPVATALRALRRELPAEFDAAAARALALKRLLPELGDPLQAGDRAALFAAVCSVFGEMARVRPIALVLDDLQWTDHATLELLPLLDETARGTALLVIAVYSVDAVTGAHPIRALRDTLRRARRLAEIPLGALNEEGVRLLAERCVGGPVDAGAARRLLAASGGVAFFVEALAHSTLASGSEALASQERMRDAVIGRFDRLTPAGRSAAEAAAVIGTEFELAAVARLAGSEAGVEELLGSGLALERTHGAAIFRPALVRDALYAAIPWTRRRHLHRAAAEGLDVHQAAEHWQAAGEPLRARKAWLEAAERARALYSHRDAARALNQALDRWSPGEEEAARLAALDLLGDASQLAGSTADALKAWREVAASAAANPLAAPRALRKIANLHELNGDWTRCIHARQEAQAAFAAAGEYAEAALEGIAAGNRLRNLSQHAAGLEVAVRAAADAEASGKKDLQVRVAALKANLEVRLGRTGEISAIRSALEAALALDQPVLVGEIYQRLADSIERSGDYGTAAAVNREGIQFCEQRKAPPGILACLACMSWILIRCGEWEHAALTARRMAQDFSGNALARGAGHGFLGLVHALRGDLRKAEPLLQEGLVLARRVGHVLLEATCLWGLAMHGAASGNDAVAGERCSAILARLRGHDERHAVMPMLRWSASCFARAGDRSSVNACADFLSESMTRFSGPEPLSALAHTLGEMALLEGDGGRAIEQFEHAISLLEEPQLPRERIESELRAAAACEAFGRRDAAVAHTREAARRAERLGARLLEQAAADQLRRLGQALAGALGPRAGRRNEQAGLTGRQLEILGAISRGQTDKEVARSLSLSPRTVESHMAKALATLDCRSRSEAVRKASELGLLGRTVPKSLKPQ
jgi:DNA-binding CsgD family transcriptional regulator